MAAAVAMAGFATVASAQDYPTKDIRFVVTSAAGSPLDGMMRQLGKQLGEVLGQTVVVENRPGGSGAVAMSYVMSQPADGYAIVSATGSTTFTIAKGEIPFTLDDFDVVRAVQAEPSSVAVRADSPYETLEDLVEALRSDPNSIQVGGFASAGFHQFVYFQLARAAEFEPTWVPFDGGNEAALALLGGHIDIAMMTPSSALSQVQSGEIRLLGISTDGPDEYFPDVPTLHDQGYDVIEAIWRGIMVREGTPREVLDTLIEAIVEVEETEEWRNYMRSNYQSAGSPTMDDIQAQVEREVEERRTFLEEQGFIE